MITLKFFHKIRRYFNPTFKEWLEDLENEYQKEMQEFKK